VHRINVFLGELAEGHAGLIGHDNQIESGIAQCAQSVGNANDQPHIIGASQVAIVENQGVVAIEKNGGLHAMRIPRQRAAV